MEVGDGDRPRPKSWLESEEAKEVLLGLGFTIEKVEPWKKLSVISITLSLSLSRRSKLLNERERGRGFGK